jgi:hypothetical protein
MSAPLLRADDDRMHDVVALLLGAIAAVGLAVLAYWVLALDRRIETMETRARASTPGYAQQPEVWRAR